MITVYYKDRLTQTFNSVSYNCQGGFFMIIESFAGHMTTTCIPADLIDHVVVTQNT